MDGSYESLVGNRTRLFEQSLAPMHEPKESEKSNKIDNLMAPALSIPTISSLVGYFT